MPQATDYIGNEQLMDALVDKIRHGSPRSTACRALGMSPQWIYELFRTVTNGKRRPHGPSDQTGGYVPPRTLDLYTDLARRIEEAEAQFEEDLIARVYEASQTVNEKTGIPEWRAGEFLLKSHPRTRVNWHEEKSVSVTVDQISGIPDEHRMVRDLSDDALLELVDPEFRGLIQPPQQPKEAEG